MSELFRPKDPGIIESYADELAAEGRLTPVVQDSIDVARAVREKHELVFYIAGPLTGMPDEVKDRYRHTSGLVSGRQSDVAMYGYAPHINGTDPVKHPDVTPAEVRDIDYLWAVHTADLHLNFLDPTAHGNAIEAGWAEANGIPAVYVVGRGARLSRLVLGMRNIARTIIYDQFEEDGLAQIDDYLNEIETNIESQET